MIILGPVAVADNLVIGKGNDLPWHLPEDLKHFKELTLGKTVVMGRKTYESIVARLGKPLPRRKNVVITRQPNYEVPNEVLVFGSLDACFSSLASEDLYIIGGAEIFKLALPKAELLYMTRVFGNYEGDAFFPELNLNDWELVSEDKHDKFSFLSYKRK